MAIRGFSAFGSCGLRAGLGAKPVTLEAVWGSLVRTKWLSHPTGGVRKKGQRFDKAGQEKGATAFRGRPQFLSETSAARPRLDAVVHVELDRVRHHLEALHLFHLQFEICIDRIVSEHITLLEEGAIRIQ